MPQGHQLPQAVRHALLLCRGVGSVAPSHCAGAAQPRTTLGSLLESWWDAAHSVSSAAQAVGSFDLCIGFSKLRAFVPCAVGHLVVR